MAGAHPKQQFSVGEWMGKWFKSIHKPVMFWKQSGFKGSLLTETSTTADFQLFKLKPCWTYLL